MSAIGERDPWLRRWLPTPFLRWSAAFNVAAVAGVAAAPRLWPAALGALAGTHLVAAVAGMLPRSRLLGPNLDRLPRERAERGEVSLTFDDGPDPEVTPRVLDLLDRTGARASFFLVGRRAARHPELTAEIVRRGHRVENHTWSHTHRFALLGPRGAMAEIDRAQRELGERTGRTPEYFRPPAGIRSPWLGPLLDRRGLCLASWTRRGLDTVTADPQRVVRRLLRDLDGGDVLLLHDGPSGRHRTVLAALPPVLAAIDAAGLACVPLPSRPHEAVAAGTAGRAA